MTLLGTDRRGQLPTQHQRTILTAVEPVALSHQTRLVPLSLRVTPGRRETLNALVLVLGGTVDWFGRSGPARRWPTGRRRLHRPAARAVPPVVRRVPQRGGQRIAAETLVTDGWTTQVVPLAAELLAYHRVPSGTAYPAVLFTVFGNNSKVRQCLRMARPSRDHRNCRESPHGGPPSTVSVITKAGRTAGPTSSPGHTEKWRRPHAPCHRRTLHITEGAACFAAPFVASRRSVVGRIQPDH
jgi:hypothetical protein